MIEKIERAYRRVGRLSKFYDGMMLNRGALGRFAMKFFWRLDDAAYEKFIRQAFAGVPDGFDGCMLEIPVGTGILSLPRYEKLTRARIVCADYSQEMLDAARKNSNGFSIDNVEFVQCDVGAMPFDDESFDLVLSIDGFHAFPDKDAAYRETHRVLKPDGILCGCMYVCGLNSRTDWFVEQFCQRQGFFTPPFETLSTLSERLKRLYSKVELSHVEAFAGFVCHK